MNGAGCTYAASTDHDIYELPTDANRPPDEQVCQWKNSKGASTDCFGTTTLKPKVVKNAKTEGILHALNDTIQFKFVFKSADQSPFEINWHEFLVWKGEGNADFCDPMAQALCDDSECKVLSKDPNFKLERNPSTHEKGIQLPNKLTIGRSTPFNKFMYL